MGMKTAAERNPVSWPLKMTQFASQSDPGRGKSE